MAADGVNEINLVLVHGQAKHDLSLVLPPCEAGDVLTVCHLAKEIEEKTRVPISGQKLIYKGKSLNDQAASLSSVGLKEGSKVMLIGKKAGPDDDEAKCKLGAIEKDVLKSEKNLSEITHTLDGVHRGFFDKKHKSECLKKLSKRLAHSVEEFTRLLERLDAVTIHADSKEIRAQRKKLVTQVQKSLELCDELNISKNVQIVEYLKKTCIKSDGKGPNFVDFSRKQSDITRNKNIPRSGYTTDQNVRKIAMMASNHERSQAWMSKSHDTYPAPSPMRRSITTLPWRPSTHYETTQNRGYYNRPKTEVARPQTARERSDFKASINDREQLEKRRAQTPRERPQSARPHTARERSVIDKLDLKGDEERRLKGEAVSWDYDKRHEIKKKFEDELKKKKTDDDDLKKKKKGKDGKYQRPQSARPSRRPGTPRAAWAAANDDNPDSYEYLLELTEALGEARPWTRGVQNKGRIPVKKYNKTGNKECSICTNEYKVNEKLSVLQCLHDFHVQCLEPWLRENDTCPVCREEIKV